MKKFFSSLFLLALLVAGFAPMSTLAAPCTQDYDGDGYYSDGMAAITDAVNANERFQQGEPGACEGTIGIKGYEAAICDCPNIRNGSYCASVGSELTPANLQEIVADPTGLSRKGSSFNPGASDTPNDGIDSNCDGIDTSGLQSNTDIPTLIQQAVTFLGQIVAGVSTLFLIWGAIMYASAAGDEQKTAKARKTMIGAIVGLIIGVLAWQLIGIVISQVTG